MKHTAGTTIGVERVTDAARGREGRRADDAAVAFGRFALCQWTGMRLIVHYSLVG